MRPVPSLPSLRRPSTWAGTLERMSVHLLVTGGCGFIGANYSFFSESDEEGDGDVDNSDDGLVIVTDTEGPDRIGTVAFRLGGAALAAGISYLCLAVGRTAPGG